MQVKFLQKNLQYSELFYTFAVPNHTMRLSHLPYYQDRSSIADLCCDFPADELLIEGLNGMQCHLFSIGQNIEIPVLHVMNTAHYLAAYMFGTQCSGDRIEYDMMVYDSMGRDRQLMAITLITLAAMLDRTDGMRARHCRSILLEDRSEDFYEGMNLYERFIHSGEKLFAEQDFMTDMMAEITDLRQQAQQLINDKQQLQKQLKEMENKQNNQYIQYNAPVYNGCTFNNTTNNINYTQPTTAETHKQPQTAAEDIEPVNTSFFCTERFAADIIEKNLHDAINLASSKADACRRIRALETCGYIVLSNVNDARKAELINPFATPKYVFTADDFSYARRKAK